MDYLLKIVKNKEVCNCYTAEEFPLCRNLEHKLSKIFAFAVNSCVNNQLKKLCQEL